MKLKEKMIDEALKKTKDLLKKRLNAKKIDELAPKLDFKKPKSIADLIKTQDMYTPASRDKTTALYEQLKGMWDKVKAIS